MLRIEYKESAVYCKWRIFVFFGGKFGAKRGMYVLLRWLWKWQGLVQREGQARQGCLKRVCPRALSTDAYKWSQKVGAGRTDRKRPRLQRTQSQQSVHMARVMVQSEGWLSFYNDSGNGSIRCNGRGKPLALRKASGIVRMRKQTSIYGC